MMKREQHQQQQQQHVAADPQALAILQRVTQANKVYVRKVVNGPATCASSLPLVQLPRQQPVLDHASHTQTQVPEPLPYVRAVTASTSRAAGAAATAVSDIAGVDTARVVPSLPLHRVLSTGESAAAAAAAAADTGRSALSSPRSPRPVHSSAGATRELGRTGSRLLQPHANSAGAGGVIGPIQLALGGSDSASEKEARLLMSWTENTQDWNRLARKLSFVTGKVGAH